MKTWHAFAFLIVTAVLWYYAGKLILVIAGLVLFFRLWWFLCERYPRTMFTITAFLSGLLGSGRRRW